MNTQRITSSSIYLLLVALVLEAASLPTPNAHKVLVVERNDETNAISKSDVGASWGGFSASAGLGGGPNGGGLHAEAGGPGLGAGAGLSGTSYSASQAGAHAGASAGTGATYGSGGATAGATAGSGAGGHGGAQGGFFDNVFNIPISVLQAVNSYLNQKGTVQRHPHARHPSKVPHEQPTLPHSVPAESNSGASASAQAGSGTYAEVGAGASAQASASAGAGSSATVPSSDGTVTYAKGHGQQHYDNVFNIPISALRSVNQLLNG